MSKFVKEYPDRQTTSQKLTEIEADLEKFRQEEEALDDQLQQRKKQFYLLIQTIHQVQFHFYPQWSQLHLDTHSKWLDAKVKLIWNLNKRTKIPVLLNYERKYDSIAQFCRLSRPLAIAAYKWAK